MIKASFQYRVQKWCVKCFGEALGKGIMERRLRFLEESLELMQSCGGTQKEAQALLNHVFSRPPGEAGQEVGGVMVTLGALCASIGVSMVGAGEAELGRVEERIEKIRSKHNLKPDNIVTGRTQA